MSSLGVGGYLLWVLQLAGIDTDNGIDFGWG
jgi:hypothetical protein